MDAQQQISTERAHSNLSLPAFPQNKNEKTGTDDESNLAIPRNTPQVADTSLLERGVSHAETPVNQVPQNKDNDVNTLAEEAIKEIIGGQAANTLLTDLNKIFHKSGSKVPGVRLVSEHLKEVSASITKNQDAVDTFLTGQFKDTPTADLVKEVQDVTKNEEGMLCFVQVCTSYYFGHLQTIDKEYTERDVDTIQEWKDIMKGNQDAIDNFEDRQYKNEKWTDSVPDVVGSVLSEYAIS